jgi:plastocyanin
MMWMMMWWMVLFWIIVLGGGVWLIVSMSRGRGNDRAEEMLRERLARGEIDVEEFNRRLAAMNVSASSRGLRRSWLVAGGALVLVLFVLVPAVVMATNGMDMWDMHGRGRNTSGDSVVQGGAESDVRIEDFSFKPGNLEVAVGARVTWTNEDSAPHDATARNGDWKTERLSEGESDTLTFDTSGTYDYYCSIHPSMKARLVVR